MKKILLVAPPFCGHLNPVLGIGCRLARDCQVVVASTASAVHTAARAGLEGRVLLAGAEDRVRAIAEPGTSVKNHPLGLLRQFRENVALMVEMKAELDGILCAERPDLVIADFTVPVAGISAGARGIPWWTVTPSPCVFETPDGPPAYFGGQEPATGRLGKLRHAAMRRATRGFKRAMVHLFRREFRSLGVAGPYRADGSEALYSPHRILALGIAEIEFPRSYPPHFEFVGPPLYTPPGDFPSPDFQEDGRPRVLVTLGTHLAHEKRSFAAEIRGVARRNPGIVFHFSYGKAGSVVPASEGNFHEFDFISYADHLHRYDAVVHHSGTGIMHHCLAAGLPSVVKPLDFDQFDYAARMIAAGVAVSVADDPEKAILAALHDRGLKERCLAMRGVVARYHPAERIAELVRGG